MVLCWGRIWFPGARVPILSASGLLLCKSRSCPPNHLDFLKYLINQKHSEPIPVSIFSLYYLNKSLLPKFTLCCAITVVTHCSGNLVGKVYPWSAENKPFCNHLHLREAGVCFCFSNFQFYKTLMFDFK